MARAFRLEAVGPDEAQAMQFQTGGVRCIPQKKRTSLMAARAGHHGSVRLGGCDLEAM